MTAKFIGGDGINDANIPPGAGAAAAEGAIITCPCLPSTATKGTFQADCKAEYNTDPGTYAAEGFDSANIFLDAFKAGKTTREDIQAFVNSYDKAGHGVTNKFDSKGDVDLGDGQSGRTRSTDGRGPTRRSRRAELDVTDLRRDDRVGAGAAGRFLPAALAHRILLGAA